MTTEEQELTELEAFREEVRRWLDENAPPALLGQRGRIPDFWGGRKPVFALREQEDWFRACLSRGYTAPSWPVEYGGAGLAPAQAKLVQSEIEARGLPRPLIGFGLTMIGPTLLQYGTDAQRSEHLPRISAGQIRWCQGYSEPGAGSDLASLSTSAVRDGDEFVVNGSKVWTSYADQADWIFALVRTNPEAKKQAGITFLLIDMAEPGISVSPIALISGFSPFCATFFDDVRVPVSNVVHEIDAGWTVAKALLQFERDMIGNEFGRSVGDGASESLADLARRYEGVARDEPLEGGLRDEIAAMEMQTRSFELLAQRASDCARAGESDGPGSSVLKVYGTETNMRRYDLLVRIAGPQALGWDGPGFGEDELSRTREWLRSRGNSIEGGTTEVQLNIIAKRSLGLPD